MIKTKMRAHKNPDVGRESEETEDEVEEGKAVTEAEVDQMLRSVWARVKEVRP